MNQNIPCNRVTYVLRTARRFVMRSFICMQRNMQQNFRYPLGPASQIGHKLDDAIKNIIEKKRPPGQSRCLGPDQEVHRLENYQNVKYVPECKRAFKVCEAIFGKLTLKFSAEMSANTSPPPITIGGQLWRQRTWSGWKTNWQVKLRNTLIWNL